MLLLLLLLVVMAIKLLIIIIAFMLDKFTRLRTGQAKTSTRARSPAIRVVFRASVHRGQRYTNQWYYGLMNV